MARKKNVKLALDLTFLRGYGPRQCRTAFKAVGLATRLLKRNPDADPADICDEVRKAVGDDTDDLIRIIEAIFAAIKEAKEE
jgi:hypothetical protein